jgi:RNA polymerase sigma-70 factor (ECF subfamily)
MQLACAGLEAALAVLVRRHERALRAYCARVCGPDLADDVAQDAFVALWSARDRYEAHGRFRAYLFTLAERRAQNALRTRGRALRRHDALGLEPAPTQPDQLEAVLAGERQRRLDALIARLPDEQQRALQLRYSAGLEYAEIAQIVARPEATVRTRVFQGLKRLRAFLRGGAP